MLADSINLFQIFISKLLVDNISELFGNFWDICNRLKIVRVFPVVVRNLLAIRPHTDRCASGVAVRLQLFLAICQFGLFELNNDVGNHQTILIHNGNISALNFATKMNREFNFNTACRITVLVDKLVEVELTHCFFRFKRDFFITFQTFNKERFLASDSFDNDSIFNIFACFLRKE